MKILITESQFKNILDEYFNRIIKKPQFSFVDRIEVIEGTTKRAKWTNTYESPFYEYIVYVHNYNDRLEELYEIIGDTHKILFPPDDKGTHIITRAYYTINTEYS